MSRLTRTFHLISPLAIGLSIAIAVLWMLGQPISRAQAAPAASGSSIRALNATAGITLVKTAPAVISQTLGAGQTLLPYNFNIDNPSAFSIIPNAIVTDDLPNNLTLLGGTTGPDWTGIFPPFSTAVTYTLLNTTTATNIDVGGYSAIVPVPARDRSIFINPTYCFSGDVNGTPQSFCESNPVTTTLRAPDFYLTENAIAPICAGSYFTYTIVLTNPGGVRTALPYTITGQITPVLTVVTGSISNGGLFTPNTITWTDSTNLLANGGNSITRTFSAFIPLATPHGTPLTNTYTVTSPEVLPNIAVWQSSNVSVTKLTSAFTWTNTSAICVNNEVFFQNNSTGASSYQWDFGDGTPHSSVANPSHTYLSAGTYSVVLTATGSCGTNVSTHAITVGALPSPSISIAPSPTQLGITTTFTDIGSGGVSWLWNFGDGITSTVLTSSTFHIYTVTPGNVTVALTSTTAFGCFNSTSQSLLVNPGAPYTITLTANPTQTLVGTKSLIGANVTDQWGNPVLNGTNINFTAAPPPAFVAPTIDPTISGFASTYVTSTLAGQTTVTGTAPNGAHGSTIVTFTVDAPYTVTLIASPLTLPVGNGSILTATVVDRYANPIPNQIITFTTASNLGSGSIAPIFATSNILGQANSIVTSTLPGVKTIMASATSSVFGTANVTFTVGAPFTITLTANPLAQTVGNTSALSATVTDQFSNLISGVVISFTTGDNLGLGSISPATDTTDGSGTAHSAVMSTDANAKTIIGTTPNLITGSVVVTFVAGPPYRITMSAIPPTRTVGLSSNIRARVFDQYDNVVAGTTISFTTPDALGAGGLIPAATPTNLFGYADSFITSTLIGPKHVVATSSNLITASTVVTFFADVPYSLTLIALPISLPVGNTSTLTATLTDQFSNPLSGFTIALITIDPLGGGALTPLSGVTDVFGRMTSAISSTLPGVKTITANTSGLTATAAVTFTTGAPFTITLIGLPSTLPVGNNSTLTATVTDKFANPISGDFVAFSSSSLGSGGISPLGVATNAGGQSTSSISSTLVGPHVVQAQEFSSGLTATTIITWTAGAATNLTLIANPTTLNVGSASNLTATLTDAFSNPIIGSSITFSTIDPLGAGSLSSPATTDGAGNARSAITSTLIGVKTITATNGSLFASAQVTFTANAPVSITLIAIPNTLPVGLTSFLTATETDQYGNPIGSRFISFSSNGNPPVPAGNTTNGSGQATSSITSPIAGTFVVTASDFLSPTINGTALVTFTAGAPTQLLLIGIPATQSVGGTSTLSATLRDAFSNPLAGFTVNFATTDPLGAGSINPASNTTGLNGVATSAISSTLSGVKTITATAGGLTATTQVTFAVGSPVSITLIALPNVLPVGSTSALTATEVDQYGNPIVGRFISLASSGPAPAPPGGTTNGGGQVTSNLASFSAGTFVVTATDFLSPTIFGTTLVTFTTGAPVTLTLIALPANQSVGNASLLTATLVDAFSNPIAGTVISFTTSDPLGSGSITPASNTTGVNGVATSAITSTLTGVKLITATNGSLFASAQVTFTSNAPVSITLIALPNVLPVGSTSALTATEVDQYGNPSVGRSISLTSSGPVPAPPGGTTNGSGQVTSNLTSFSAGTFVVTATDSLSPTIFGTTLVTFTTGAPVTLTLIALPANQSVGNASLLTATLVDAFSNPIAGTVISFTTTDPLGSGSITPASNTTGVTGVATSAITSTLSGVKTITATTGSLTATAQVTFSVGTLVGITVTPNPITVTVGSTQQFTATGFDQFSNPVPITPTWTTNGGSINASGFFTAQLTPAVGKIVTATQGSISGTAIVNIITGSLATIIVTPNPITLTVNTVQPFVATGYDAFSNTVPIAPTWTSSGGSIDASGVFTAPGAPINGLIITATQGLISGTAIVNVVAVCIPVSGADFTYTPASPVTTSTVTFTGTVAAGTVPITYTWNFGDGSPIGLGNPTTHLYPIAGPYTIVMTATNGCASSSNSHLITVSAAGPTSSTIYLPIIVNNYPLPPQFSFSLGGYVVLENAGSASITVVLTGSNGLTSTVDYATSDGTATAPADYASTSGTLVFPPGVTTQTFSVSIVNDALNEFPETVLLTLSNPSNATIKPPATETLTIIDDDGGGVSCAPTVITTTASTYHPMGLAFDPVTMHLFVANRDGGGSLSVIDTLAVATIHVVPGLNSAQGAAFDAGRNRIYVSGWDSVYVIDGSTYSVISTILIGSVLTPPNSLAVAYNPTSDKIYVTGYDDDSITIINAGTLSIVQRLTNTGSHPLKEPANIAVNPISNKVYIANHNGGLPTAWISVVDGSSDNVIATIYTGSGSTHGGDLYGITADTVHNLIYVNAIDVARVYVIDGATDMLTGDIQILRSSDLTPVPLRLSAVNPIAGPNTHLWLTSSSTEPRGLDRLIVLSGNWPSFGSPVATAVQPSSEGGLLFDPATWNVFASNNNSNLVTFSRDSLNLCPTPLAPSSENLVPVIHEYPHGRMGD